MQRQAQYLTHETPHKIVTVTVKHQGFDGVEPYTVHVVDRKPITYKSPAAAAQAAAAATTPPTNNKSS
jgi:hypothetical protein